MTKPRQTWWEKWLAEEEGSRSSDSSSEEASKVTLARGEDNPDLGNSNSSKENDRQGEKPVSMDVNMVFTVPAEFCVPTEDVVELELALGAKRAIFEKPENPSAHMKPLFIQGHLDKTPIGHMLVNGGANINILPLSLFKKLDHVEGDLKCTNLSLSGFAGDPMETKGIICKEVTVGSKIVPMAFFMVDVKGRYNVLLGRDWIHANDEE
jgi:hypothetical protein